jgi:hypothetical protein
MSCRLIAVGSASVSDRLSANCCEYFTSHAVINGANLKSHITLFCLSKVTMNIDQLTGVGRRVHLHVVNHTWSARSTLHKCRPTHITSHACRDTLHACSAISPDAVNLNAERTASILEIIWQ